jgi:hypothetical protein
LDFYSLISKRGIMSSEEEIKQIISRKRVTGAAGEISSSPSYADKEDYIKQRYAAQNVKFQNGQVVINPGSIASKRYTGNVRGANTGVKVFMTKEFKEKPKDGEGEVSKGS